MIGGFDRFGHSGNLQPFCRFDHHFQDLTIVLCAVVGLKQEGAIQLQFINGKLAERGERSIAASKVVHRHPEAMIVQLPDLLGHLLRIFQRKAFQNLQHDETAGHIIALGNGTDTLHIVLFIKEQFGLVH